MARTATSKQIARSIAIRNARQARAAVTGTSSAPRQRARTTSADLVRNDLNAACVAAAGFEEHASYGY